MVESTLNILHTSVHYKNLAMQKNPLHDISTSMHKSVIHNKNLSTFTTFPQIKNTISVSASNTFNDQDTKWGWCNITGSHITPNARRQPYSRIQLCRPFPTNIPHPGGVRGRAVWKRGKRQTERKRGKRKTKQGKSAKEMEERQSVLK